MPNIRDTIAHKIINWTLNYVATAKFRTRLGKVIARGFESFEREINPSSEVYYDDTSRRYSFYKTRGSAKGHVVQVLLSGNHWTTVADNRTLEEARRIVGDWTSEAPHIMRILDPEGRVVT